MMLNCGRINHRKKQRRFPPMTLSQHFINDHPERMIYIGLNIGYGNVVLTCVDKQEQKRYCSCPM